MCNYMDVEKMMVKAFYAMSLGVITNYNLLINVYQLL